MKKISLLFAMIVFLFTSAMAQNSWDQNKVEEFIQDMYLENMLEVHLGQLTFTKNVSKEIMELGMKMVKDHAKANLELKDVANNMNIELPDELAAKQDNKIEKFYRMNPVDFDEQYVEMLVKHHKKAIDKLKEAKDNIDNNEFDQWVDNTMPLLKDHLEAVKEMQDMKSAKAKDRELKIEGDVLEVDK